MNPMDGAVILDKPAGITSFGAVRRVRSLIGGGKVGHVGTLDPLGTGVLPMLVGRATRLARFYLGHEREYVAGIRFGWATNTYDRDGEAVREPVDVELERPLLEELIETYRGTLSQVPPQVSAKKVDGVRAYKLARKRRPVRLDPVSVEIRELELLEVDGSLAVVRCLCSAGTYIRSLAHDLGQEMGCGAHVASLRRTLVGEFSLENAHTLESLESMRKAGRIEEAVLSPLALLPEIPVLRVNAVEAAHIRHGRDFRISPFSSCSDAKMVKAVGPDNRLLCLGKAQVPRMYHPFVVFA